MNKLCSAKQFVIIIFILGIAMKMFMLPSLLLKTSGRDSYFIIILYIILDFGILSLFLWANKKLPDSTFYDILRDVLGKIGSKIVVSLVSLYQLIKLTLILSELKVFFTISANQNILWLILVVPLIALMVAISIKTLREIGRLSEIFIYFIVLSIIILGLLVAANADFSNIFPILENGINDLTKGFLNYPMWFGNLSILLIFFGNIKRKKHIYLASIISYIISSGCVIYFALVIFSTYGNIPNLLDYGHNISNMTMYSSGTYSFGRFDIAIFCVWIISVFIQLMLVFYMLTSNFSFIITYKNNFIAGLIIAVISYILLVFVFPNEQVLYYFCTEIMKYFAYIFEYLTPVIISVMALGLSLKSHKKEKQKEPTGNEAVN